MTASSQLNYASRYVAAGLSVFPTKVDGSKTPAYSGWREYAERQPAAAELRNWFAIPDRHGIGITGGIASGNLIVFDFETLYGFNQWCQALTDDEKLALAESPVIATPKGGRHVYIRTVEPVRGCKLARTETGACLIETRGCQHYVVAPGSPPSVHATGIPYKIIRPGWLDGAPWRPMELETWHGITVHAADLSEYSRPAAREVVGDRGGVAGDRPGDHFNSRVTWADILWPHGWRVFRSSAGTTYWTRPGKPSGNSASTGFCKGRNGQDLLYIFSTSAAPFDESTSYSRFAAYAILNHHGDFRAATRALGLAGYGLPAQKAVRV